MGKVSSIFYKAALPMALVLGGVFASCSKDEPQKPENITGKPASPTPPHSVNEFIVKVEDLPQIETTPYNPNRYEWRSGMKVPALQLMTKLFNTTDIVWVGDTNHDNDKLLREIYSPQGLSTLKEVGVERNLIEMCHDRNIEYYRAREQQRQTDPDAKLGVASTGTLRGIFFDNNGIEVIGVDPQSHEEKYGFITPNLTYPEMIKALYKRNMTDPQLAERVAALAIQGGKTLVIYGAAHGSSDNDQIAEAITQAGLSMVRVDFYLNRDDFLKNMFKNLHYNAEIDAVVPDNEEDFGKDLPDLIYFVEEGTVHYTEKTAESIRALIQSLIPTQSTGSAPEVK